MKARFILLFLLFLPFIIYAQTDSLNVIDEVFEKVETNASFAGGDMAWRQYLERNLNASLPMENGAPLGVYTVLVQFIVDKEGNISGIKALTNHGYGMEQEVIRIIKAGPKWTPATQNGRYVKAYRRQPVTFVMMDPDIDIDTGKESVLYINKDNKVSISVRKTRNEDLEFTMTQGTISNVSGSDYIIRVNKPGKVILDIYKKNKRIASAYFAVKETAVQQ